MIRAWLRRGSWGLLAGLLVVLPLVGGKLWVWQGLLVSLVVGAAVVMRAAGRAAQQPVELTDKPLRSRRQTARARGAAPAEARLAEPADGTSASWQPDGLDLALIAFWLTQILSVLWSVYPFASALYGAKVTAYVLLFWLLRYGLAGGRWQRVMFWGLGLGGAVAGVWALREYVRTVWFLGEANWRVFGPMVNPNALAAYFLLTLPPMVALLAGSSTRSGDGASGSRPRYAEIAAGFSLLIMLLALLLTGSKGGLAALVVGLVVTAIVTPGAGVRGRRVRLATGVLVVMLGGLVAALPPMRARLATAWGSQAHSAIFRAYTWRTTLNMIRARPLGGSGGGTFEQAMPAYAIAGYTRAAHQSYLQLAAETGVGGLLTGLLWGGLVLGRLARGSRRPGGRLGRLGAAAALGGLVASGVQGLVDYAWYSPATGAAFFALAGLGVALGDEGLSPSRKGMAGSNWWRGAAVVVGVGLMLWTGKNLYAEAIGGQGEALAARRAYAAASTTYARASRINPAQARLWAQRARVEEALALSGDPRALPQAIAARLAASRLQPTEPQHYVALSRLYEMAQRWPEAEAAAREALVRYPAYPRGLMQLAQVQRLSGDRAGALATYQRLQQVYESPVGQYPAVPEIIETAFVYGWLGLGEEAREQGDWPLTAEYLGQAVQAVASELQRHRSLQAQLGDSGDGGGEELRLTELVREQLVLWGGPLAEWWQARLWRALGREADEQVCLRAALVATAQRPEELRAAAAAAWRLAQLTEPEFREGKLKLVAKGIDLWTASGGERPGEERGWRAAERTQMDELKKWAESQLPGEASRGQ